MTAPDVELARLVAAIQIPSPVVASDVVEGVVVVPVAVLLALGH